MTMFDRITVGVVVRDPRNLVRLLDVLRRSLYEVKVLDSPDDRVVDVIVSDYVGDVLYFDGLSPEELVLEVASCVFGGVRVVTLGVDLGVSRIGAVVLADNMPVYAQVLHSVCEVADLALRFCEAARRVGVGRRVLKVGYVNTSGVKACVDKLLKCVRDLFDEVLLVDEQFVGSRKRFVRVPPHLRRLGEDVADAYVIARTRSRACSKCVLGGGVWSGRMS